MGATEEALRRALGQLAAGSAAVWAPQVTTSQAARLPSLLQIGQAAKGRAGATYSADSWLVFYEGSVLPEADDPAWTEVEVGTVDHEIDEGALVITDEGTGESLHYYLDLPELDNAVGTLVEARVKVASATAGPGRGAALTICDGTYQFAVWLRDTGFNIDGRPSIAEDFTRYRRVRFEARGIGCRVSVDGVLRQEGGYVQASANKRVAFGSHTAE